jgi:hypothetical protein
VNDEREREFITIYGFSVLEGFPLFLLVVCTIIQDCVFGSTVNETLLVLMPSCSGAVGDIKQLVPWFKRCGGTVDETAIGFTTFPPEDGGRGVIALKDIVVRSMLNSLLLSGRVSSLTN